MYLAMILFCSTPSADTCNNLVNTNQLHLTEEACTRDYEVAMQRFIEMGVYSVRGACIQIGTPA